MTTIIAVIAAVGSPHVHAVTDGPEREAARILHTVYPGYTLFPTPQFGEDVTYALSISENKHSPVAVGGDFDGNGQVDYAALAMDENRDVIFVILMADATAHYGSAYELRLGRDVNYVMLNPVDAGSVIAMSDAVQHDESPVRLQRPAVELVYVGKAMVVYYWDPKTGKISAIATGD